MVDVALGYACVLVSGLSVPLCLSDVSFLFLCQQLWLQVVWSFAQQVSLVPCQVFSSQLLDVFSGTADECCSCFVVLGILCFNGVHHVLHCILQLLLFCVDLFIPPVVP